jgi:nucleoside-diphosphate-sugar epimerase
MSPSSPLEGKQIVLTGAGGQVGLPIARALAPKNEVHAVARFSNPADREQLEALGIRCVQADLAHGDLGPLPAGPDCILNFAVSKTGTNAVVDPSGADGGDWDYDLAANAEGIGRLMGHCREAGGVLHCSTTGVYEHKGHEPLREADPLGDNHRAILPTYSLCKIAAEAVVRFAARAFDLPTTIARLNVPYGNNGGWPLTHLDMILAGQPVYVHEEQPNFFNPIHEDDIIAQIPGMLAAASVPATILNWGGNERVSIEDWCAYMGELVGAMPKIATTTHTIASVTVDTTQLERQVGLPKTNWKDGLRRMIAAQRPDIELQG